MKKREPESIEEVLKKTIRDIEKRQGRLTEEDVQRAWAAAAGEKAAKHTKIKSLRKAMLIINVDSPVWIYQLNTEKEKLEKRLNRQIKKDTFIKIQFRAGS